MFIRTLVKSFSITTLVIVLLNLFFNKNYTCLDLISSLAVVVVVLLAYIVTLLESLLDVKK